MTDIETRLALMERLNKLLMADLDMANASIEEFIMFLNDVINDPNMNDVGSMAGAIRAYLDNFKG